MPILRFPISKGTATGIDPAFSDQLQESVGVVYQLSDPAMFKFPGRSAFASAFASAAVGGIAYAKYHDATESIFALDHTALAGLQRATAGVLGTFSALSLPGSGAWSGTHLDSIVYNNVAFLCSGAGATNFAVKQDGTVLNHGMAAPGGSFTPTAAAGPGQTGDYYYWITDYDSANGLESVGSTAQKVSLANQNTLITLGMTSTNPSADKFRIYRTIAGGLFPAGWLVAEVSHAAGTYTDTTSDATLVLNAPYGVVTINGISESRDVVPPVFTSIATLSRRLVGVTGHDNTLQFSPTGYPHSFPVSYSIGFIPKYGGPANCVRQVGQSLYVLFDNETFKVNYLPDESDSAFDTGIVQEPAANYGTPSPMGACVFTGWGGKPMLFVASPAYPVLMNEDGVDLAVSNIDWPNTVPLGVLNRCHAVDNPDQWRVELYFQDSASDTTSWSVLHFYYDSGRLEHKTGTFPEMVWTGPHKCPGPGVFGRASGQGYVWTISRSTAGTVWTEAQGHSDAANLIDSNGTIQFRARTRKEYVGEGPGTEARATRVHIYAQGGGTGTYDSTITLYKDESDGSSEYRQLDATPTGYTSEALNSGCRAVDVRIVRDDAVAMPGIYDISVEIEDVKPYIKTVRP